MKLTFTEKDTVKYWRVRGIIAEYTKQPSSEVTCDKNGSCIRPKRHSGECYP
jgi:hypothetical protein